MTQKWTRTPMVTWSLTKEIKLSSGKKDSIFSKWCWFNWWLACRRMQIDLFLSPCTMLKSKWIKNLHIKPETEYFYILATIIFFLIYWASTMNIQKQFSHFLSSETIYTLKNTNTIEKNLVDSGQNGMLYSMLPCRWLCGGGGLLGI